MKKLYLILLFIFFIFQYQVKCYEYQVCEKCLTYHVDATDSRKQCLECTQYQCTKWNTYSVCKLCNSVEEGCTKCDKRNGVFTCYQYSMECNSNQFKNDIGKCIDCLENCILCENAESCAKCDQEKVLAHDKKSCLDNCPNGYAPNDGYCEVDNSDSSSNNNNNNSGENNQPTTELKSILSMTNEQEIIQLQFNRKPTFDIDHFQNNVEIDFSGLDSSQFSYTIKVVKDTIIEITFAFKDSHASSQSLSVKYTAPNPLDSIFVSLTYPPYYKQTESEKEQLQEQVSKVAQEKQMTQGVSVGVSTLAPMAGGGALAFRSALSMDILFLIKFIDIQLPANMITFFQDLPTDVFTLYNPDLNEGIDDQEKVKNKFLTYETSPYVINNITNSFVIFMIPVSIALIYYLIKICLQKFFGLKIKKPALNKKDLDKIGDKSQLKQSLTFKQKCIDFAYTCWYYIDLILLFDFPTIIFIQNYVDFFLYSMTNMIFATTSTSIGKLNLAMAVLFFLFCLAFLAISCFLIIAYYKFNKRQNEQIFSLQQQEVNFQAIKSIGDSKQLKKDITNVTNLAKNEGMKYKVMNIDITVLIQRVKCLYEESQDHRIFFVLYTWMDIMRLTILAFIVSVFYNLPKVALPLFFIVDLAFVIYAYVFRPLKFKFSMVVVLGNELMSFTEVILVSCMGLLDFTSDEIDQEAMIKLGNLLLDTYRIHNYYNMITMIIALFILFPEKIQAFINFLKRYQIIRFLINKLSALKQKITKSDQDSSKYEKQITIYNEQKMNHQSLDEQGPLKQQGDISLRTDDKHQVKKIVDTKKELRSQNSVFSLSDMEGMNKNSNISSLNESPDIKSPTQKILKKKKKKKVLRKVESKENSGQQKQVIDSSNLMGGKTQNSKNQSNQQISSSNQTDDNQNEINAIIDNVNKELKENQLNKGKKKKITRGQSKVSNSNSNNNDLVDQALNDLLKETHQLSNELKNSNNEQIEQKDDILIDNVNDDDNFNVNLTGKATSQLNSEVNGTTEKRPRKQRTKMAGDSQNNISEEENNKELTEQLSLENSVTYTDNQQNDAPDLLNTSNPKMRIKIKKKKKKKKKVLTSKSGTIEQIDSSQQ